MSSKLESLYSSMMKADEEFHAAVVAQFGRKWAGTMRYCTSAFVPSTRRAAKEFQQACEEYLEECAALRAEAK